MTRPTWLTVLLLAVLALAATAWWTRWLDPHVPPLAGWREQAQRSAMGAALSPEPEASWVTTPGRSKADCLRHSQGELNPAFVLCRSGKRELVRVARDGSRTVLRTEPLPEPQGLFRP
ncbi:hypothetical protein CCO03_11465 [Comamonas serinivorans]|uniref:Uncharacterized protein n=1 Tax=Comamonas serinivorans TaxID=1082851 RepID=A0A1Y0EP31_9BURK|nr:hypothetical protein [Comamonas serinivorans]ARU05218.1 hypothetical protein CCO03_11465 [Comamonas serinivorans]